MSDAPFDPGRMAGGMYRLLPIAGSWPSRPVQGDTLSDPELDLVAETLFAALPKGAAWRSPDNAAFDRNSRLAAFWRSFAPVLAETYGRLFRLTQESTASTLDQSLEEWELEYGLPDPCFGETQTRTQRIRALLAKVRSTGIITKGDFVGLAASISYTIEITEPLVFVTGFSRLGEPHGTGHAAHFFWRVHVTGRATKRFETGRGKSRTGIDSLLDISRATDLECLFRGLKPGWTRVIFDYS